MLEQIFYCRTLWTQRKFRDVDIVKACVFRCFDSVYCYYLPYILHLHELNPETTTEKPFYSQFALYNVSESVFWVPPTTA